MKKTIIGTRKRHSFSVNSAVDYTTLQINIFGGDGGGGLDGFVEFHDNPRTIRVQWVNSL